MWHLRAAYNRTSSHYMLRHPRSKYESGVAKGRGGEGEWRWRGLRCALYLWAMLSLECSLVGSSRSVQPSTLVRHLHGLIELMQSLMFFPEFKTECCNTTLRPVKDLPTHPERIGEILRAGLPSLDQIPM